MLTQNQLKKHITCFSPFFFGCDIRSQEDREQESKEAECFDLSLLSSISTSNKQKKTPLPSKRVDSFVQKNKEIESIAVN